MNHVAGRQVPAGGDHRFSGRALALGLAYPPAFFEDPGPATPVDGAVDSTAALERGVGGVHDRIGFLIRDVTTLEEKQAVSNGNLQW